MVARRRSKPFNRGWWEVQRERLQIESERPPDERPQATISLEEALPNVLKKMGLADRFWERQLLDEWSGIVGGVLARQTRPGHIERGILSVFVTNSSWLFEIQRNGQKQLLANVQKRFGPDRIRGLRLALDPDLERRPAARG